MSAWLYSFITNWLQEKKGIFCSEQEMHREGMRDRHL